MTELKTGRIPDDLYQQILQVMPRPCVDLVVKCNGEILMLKRRIDPMKGYWALPGGMVNKGENMSEAAIRKADEELGVKVLESELKLVGIVNHYHFARQDIAITFAVSVSEKPDIKIDYQHREYRWLSLEDVLELGELVDSQVLIQIEFALGMSDGLSYA